MQVLQNIQTFTDAPERNTIH